MVDKVGYHEDSNVQSLDIRGSTTISFFKLKCEIGPIVWKAKTHSRNIVTLVPYQRICGILARYWHMQFRCISYLCIIDPYHHPKKPSIPKYSVPSTHLAPWLWEIKKTIQEFLGLSDPYYVVSKKKWYFQVFCSVSWIWKKILEIVDEIKGLLLVLDVYENWVWCMVAMGSLPHPV